MFLIKYLAQTRFSNHVCSLPFVSVPLHVTLGHGEDSRKQRTRNE